MQIKVISITKCICLLSIMLNVNSFKIPQSKIEISKFFDINHNIHEQYNALGDKKQWFEPNMFSIIDNYHDSLGHDTIGRSSVKLISSLLPKVDSIGGHILHANNMIIDYTLNNEYIPHELQKEIILKFIKIAQYGDNMGSSLLQSYYEFVSNSL